jgi:hypothetical protein
MVESRRSRAKIKGKDQGQRSRAKIKGKDQGQRSRAKIKGKIKIKSGGQECPPHMG